MLDEGSYLFHLTDSCEIHFSFLEVLLYVIKCLYSLPCPEFVSTVEVCFKLFLNTSVLTCLQYTCGHPY